MQTSISPQAPLEERRRITAERIVRETLQLYCTTGHLESTKAEMTRRHDEIVAERDRWWLSESFYSWLVKYAVRSASENQQVVSL